MDFVGQYEHAKEMWRPFDGGVFAARLSPTAAVRRLPRRHYLPCGSPIGAT